MNSEDTAARRRVTRAPGAHTDDDGQWRAQDDDDSGKGFHAKPGLHPPRFIGGGRLPSRGPPPPAQNERTEKNGQVGSSGKSDLRGHEVEISKVQITN